MFKHILGAAAVAALLSVGCSSSTSTSTTPATTDAGKADSGSVVLADSGTSTPSADAGAPAAVCAPPDTTPTFSTPSALPATAAWAKGVCQSATVGAFVTACLGSTATKALCDSWKSANASCSSCLLTANNAAAIGPFVTDPSITADDNNPPGLVQDGFLGSIQGCLNHFKAGCGEKYFGFANCLNAACNDKTNCKNASQADQDTCTEDAIGGGQGVCGDVAIAALGTNGACKGVFPQDAGSAITGEACFAASSEDTSTEAGISAYFTRLGMMYCGN